MARNPRASRLETRTARLKLPIRGKPFDFTTISPSIALGYRRNRAAGVWVVRAADGHGGNWTKRVALADDFEEADGTNVLTWWQAIEAARKLARGTDADTNRLASFADAINSYQADLRARGGNVANAQRIRKHITPTLASKPVGLLTAREFAHWRDGLLAAGMKPATAVRLFKNAKAALTLAAKRDPRIANTAAWRDGLSGLAENFESRNPSRLSDAEVQAVVAAAYELDPAFGRYVEVAAVTGARPSQIARLLVGDLWPNGDGPRLTMPSSKKGRGRKISRKPVAITASLAGKLSAASVGRAPTEPLVLRSDGRPWQATDKSDHIKLFAKAATRAGLTGITIYALRHSSVVRGILHGLPLRVVASAHDTSVVMIERTYSAHISDFADTLSRRALLEIAPPQPGKVVPIGRRP
jgi:integrase